MKPTTIENILDDLKKMDSGHVILWYHDALKVDILSNGVLSAESLDEASKLVELRAFDGEYELHVKRISGELRSMLKSDDVFLTTDKKDNYLCLLYTSPSPRDQRGSRMPSSA